MIYQVVSAYYQLSLQGRVPDLLCRIEISHPSLIPFLDENDKIMLKCIDPDCKYKKSVGMNLYNNMLQYVKQFSDKEPDSD